MPGLAKACNPNLSVPNGAVYLYSQSWTISTVIAGVVYWILHRVRPMEMSEDTDNAKILWGMGRDSDGEKDTSVEEKFKAAG